MRRLPRHARWSCHRCSAGRRRRTDSLFFADAGLLATGHGEQHRRAIAGITAGRAEHEGVRLFSRLLSWDGGEEHGLAILPLPLLSRLLGHHHLLRLAGAGHGILLHHLLPLLAHLAETGRLELLLALLPLLLRLRLAHLRGLALLLLLLLSLLPLLPCLRHLLHGACLVLAGDVAAGIAELLGELFQFLLGLLTACLLPSCVDPPSTPGA